MVTTKILSDPVDCHSRIAELGLDYDKLIDVALVAAGASRDSTKHDPPNAPGIFAYIYGTRALRDNFVGDAWVADRTDSVESIFSERRKLRVVYQNVDCAAIDDRNPKPRSTKGVGSERTCELNQLSLFPEAPKTPPEGAKAYYLMVAVADSSITAELSLPVVRNGSFERLIERIYLIREGELEDIDIGDEPDDEGIETPDINVTRKK